MTAPPEKEAAAPRKEAAAVQEVSCSLTKGQCDNRHTGREHWRAQASPAHVKPLEFSFVKGVRSTSIAMDIQAEEALNKIRDGTWRTTVQEIRAIPEKKERDAIKTAKLPAFMVAGVFSARGKGKAANNLKRHSGLICIDLDGLQPAFVEAFRDQLFEDKHVAAAFVSPGGAGVKLWVRADATAESHSMVWQQIADYLGKRYNVTTYIDESGKNLERLCFVSFDPSAKWRGTPCIFPFHFAPYNCTLQVTPYTYTTSVVGDVAGRLQRISAAEKRDPESALLVHLYRKFVEPRIEPRANGRNEWLTQAAPFLYRCVSQDVAEGLVSLSLHIYSDIWAGGIEEHQRSFLALWKGAETIFLGSLTVNERAIYEQLDADQRAAFRICRSLWEHSKCKPFPLACDHLAHRIDVRGSVNGWRILRTFCTYEVLEKVTNGSRREKGLRGKAATYKWLPTDAAPIGI